MILPAARTDNHTHGTARARSKLTCCASSRETASAVARSRVAREGQLILSLEGSSWHVALRPHAEAEGPLAGSVALFQARTDLNQRGTARVRSKLACRTSSRESASAVAHSRVPRKSRLILGGRSWHVAPRPRIEGERPLAGAVPL